MHNVNVRRVILCNALNAISEINTELNSFSLERGNLIAMQKAPLFAVLVVHNVVSNAEWHFDLQF